MTLILGTGIGRCGTRTLAQLLAKAGLYSLHEAAPPLYELGASARTVFHYSARENVRDTLESARKTLFKKENVAEVSQWWCYLMPFVNDLWPDVKLIVLVRELWPWAKSAYRRGWFDNESDGLRMKHPDQFSALRMTPQDGWPKGRENDKWFKLSYHYFTTYAELFSDLSICDIEYHTLRCEDLSNLEIINDLFSSILDNPREITEPIYANKGSDYVTYHELKKRGYNLGKQKGHHEHERIHTTDISPKIEFEDLYKWTPQIEDSLEYAKEFALGPFSQTETPQHTWKWFINTAYGVTTK